MMELLFGINRCVDNKQRKVGSNGWKASVPTAKNDRMAARTNLALPRFGSRAVKTILSSAGEGGILGVPIDNASNTIFDAIQSAPAGGYFSVRELDDSAFCTSR